MIEIRQNSIVVRNVDLKSEEFKKIKYRFSLYDPVRFKYSFSIFTIIDNDLYFPSSVSLSAIQSCFPDKKVEENFKTTTKGEIIDFKMKSLPRNDLQKSALNFLLKIKKDNKIKQRFLSLKTGEGKTFVSISFLSQIKKKALIIVDTLSLALQ